MAMLTIRDLDESLKRSLRLRAAGHNRSMEEEARQILRAALQDEAPQVADLGARIRKRFAKLGDVTLPIAEREPVRPVLAVDESPKLISKSTPKPPGKRPR